MVEHAMSIASRFVHALDVQLEREAAEEDADDAMV